jgi:hypothetical protein
MTKRVRGICSICNGPRYGATNKEGATCMACRRKHPPTKGQVLTTVCVDHDHETNKVRGLLCNSCNKALGLFKDSPNILNQAINYLGTHGKKISNYS